MAEYERTLIAEPMRRGRQAGLRAGALLPWTTPPFGYRLDPEQFTATTPGTYHYLCPVPGHAQKGMTGTLAVSPTG